MDKELIEKDAELTEIDYRMGEIVWRLKSKMVGEKDGNPQLEYKELDFDATKERKRLESMRIDGDGLEKGLLENRRGSLLTELDSIANIGSSRIKDGYYGPTTYFLAYYDNLVPSPNDVEKAEKILEEGEKPKQKEKKDIGAEQAKERFEEYLKRKGLDWEVRVIQPRRGEIIPRIAEYYDPKNRGIELNRDTYKVSERGLEKSEKHLGFHIWRFEKGLKQQLPGTFSRGLDGRFWLTEEGLAKMVEEYYGFLDSLKTSAAHLIAVDAMIRGASYREILELLMKKGIRKGKAQRTALRVKRGLVDTSKRGGFVKDSAYLLGLWRVKDYLKEDGHINLSKLDRFGAGRVGIEHEDILKKLIEANIIGEPTFSFETFR